MLCFIQENNNNNNVFCKGFEAAKVCLFLVVLLFPDFSHKYSKLRGIENIKIILELEEEKDTPQISCCLSTTKPNTVLFVKVTVEM
jgi:hypothetical protein